MIGCGQISERFFTQARELESVRYTATCAAHKERAQRKAEQHGVGWYTDDFHALLQRDDVDAVVITTPHQMHAPMAIDALRAGKHALVEKPMATRWEHAKELVQAVEATGLTLAALPYDKVPAMEVALTYVRPDVLGKVTAIEAELSIPGPPRANWYYAKEAEGGAMLDTACYALSRIATIMGPAVRVAGFANTLIPHRLTGDGGRVESEVDDNVTLILEYAGGQQAVMRTCWAYSYGRNATAVHGRHGDIWINEYGQPLIVKSDTQPIDGAEPVAFLNLPNCYRPAVADAGESILGHFVRCIRTGERPTCNVWQGAHVIEQMMKGYESSRMGRVLSLETSFDRWWDAPKGLFDLGNAWL
jgi:predicted dehydrogenase